MFKLWMPSTLISTSLFLSAQALATSDHQADTRAANFYRAIELNNATPTSTAEKIERLSATLIGAPYVDGNLGEGEKGKYDKDPLNRFDEFDCTTYVETVMAGALSHSKQDFLPTLLKIRYKNGQVVFVNRNHFPSVDWLPNNQWFLTDITEKVAGKQTLQAKTVIDKKAWYQHMTMSRIQGIQASDEKKEALLKSLQNEGDGFAPEPVSTPYVPLTAVFVKGNFSKKESKQEQAKEERALEKIKQDSTLDEKAKQKALNELQIQQYLAHAKINQALLNRIPTGSIISMVRPDYNVKKWIGTNMNITHQSIAIRKNGKLYIRNASLIKKEVVDQEFIAYFSHYLVGSSLKGFNVQYPNLPN